MKRFISLLVVLCIFVSLAPQISTTVFATATSGTCGDNLTWTLDAEGTLAISGIGNMSEWEWGCSPWYNCLNIKKVVISSGVTCVGNYAFQECKNLTAITIPDSVTSIEDYAFYYCTSLIDIVIPNSVETIGGNAFCSCESLADIIIPDSVTHIDVAAFRYCISLTDITIPNSVTSIGDYAFSCCDNLTDIKIPESVTSIGKFTFNYCESLTNIEVSNLNINYCSLDGNLYNKNKTEIIQYAIGKTNKTFTIPEGVTSIGEDAFCSCDNLTNIIITDSVTSIGNGSFASCDNLTDITFSDNITTIGQYAFDKCGSLTAITIPDGVMSIGNYAFSYCTSLTSITIPDSVTSVGKRAFTNCINLADIVILDGVTSIGDYAFCCCESLVDIIIPDSITNIGYGAFYDCKNLENITLSKGITSINGYMFSNCDSLTGIIIPNSVTSIDNGAFISCDSLANIIIPNSVTSIGESAFYGCKSLTSIIIPDKVASIGYGMFYNCDRLTSITIPDSVTSISWYAFYGCKNLADVYYCGNEDDWNEISIDIYNEALSDAAKHWNYQYIDDAEYSGLCGDNITWTLGSDGILIISGTGKMYDYTYSNWKTNSPWFAYKSDIKEVNVTEGVTGIGRNAFCMCNEIEDIKLPKGIEYIGEFAFDYTAFSNNLQNWEDGFLYIDEYLIAYQGEKSACAIKDGTVCLAELSLYKMNYDCVSIPASVKFIGNSCFYGCEISTVYYAASEEEWNSISVGLENEALDNANIEYKTVTEDGNLKVKDFKITSNSISFNVEHIEDNDSIIYAALFDEQGKLLHLESYSALECDNISLNNEGEFLKVMWWGDKMIQPLAKNIKINLKN